MPAKPSLLVSIIVLNRNGINHLRNLLPAIVANTPAGAYELIIVDNASSDSSLEYLKANTCSLPYNLPIHLIENSENLSFSAANNQAAKLAKGKYLLLLNNDVIPTENWLQPLLQTLQNNAHVASVGAKLIYPNNKTVKNPGTVQHAGIAFRDEGDFIRPYNLGNGQTVDQPLVNKSQARPALTAACLLISKDKYFAVDGLDENYEYGFEDVDLGLKLQQLGYENYYCAESVLLHDEFGTQSKDKRTDVIERRQRNLQYFRNRWFHYLKSNYWTEKIKAKAPFYTEGVMSVLIVGSITGNKEPETSESFNLDRLISVFESFGWKVTDKTGLRNREVKASEDVDLILSLSPDYNIKKINTKRKKLYKMLWLTGAVVVKKKQWEKTVCADYDIVFDTTGKHSTSDNPVLHSLHYFTSAHPFINPRHVNADQNRKELINQWANEIQRWLLQILAGTSIAIKLPVRKWEQCHNWGDYYLALHLKGALEKENHRVILQTVPEWKNKRAGECNTVIALRGVSAYEPFDYQINLMWNISHPEAIPTKEYERYDKVFVASEAYAKKLALKVFVPVEAMLQCADPSLFYEPDQKEKEERHHSLLFIGNSRKSYKKKSILLEAIHKGLSGKVLGARLGTKFGVKKYKEKINQPYNQISRKIINDLLPAPYDLAVYGLRWNKVIEERYIKGSYVPNNELYKYYGSAEILLNDHWDDMRKHGFISNRLFDGLACGAFIISDSIEEMGEFQEFIVTYSSVEELHQHIDYYLSHPQERKQMAQNGKQYVLDNHTFEHRAKQFSDTIEFLLST